MHVLDWTASREAAIWSCDSSVVVVYLMAYRMLVDHAPLLLSVNSFLGIFLAVVVRCEMSIAYLTLLLFCVGSVRCNDDA